MAAMTEIEAYYNKFNEEKRLDSRHGRVEFNTSMKYIHDYINECRYRGTADSNIHILDIGAGTGRYSVPLADEGYDVTAVELVKQSWDFESKEKFSKSQTGKRIKFIKASGKFL